MYSLLRAGLMAGLILVHTSVFSADAPKAPAAPAAPAPDAGKKASIPALPGPPPTIELLRKAEEAYRQRRFDEAMTFANQVLELDPMNAGGLYARGRLYDDRDELDNAIADYSKVLQTQPKATGVYLRRADVFHRAGKLESAVTDYDRFLDLAPKEAPVYQKRGAANFKLGRFDESIADFDMFIKLEPEQEPYHWQRGISHYYAGRYVEGRKQFEVHQTVNNQDVENAVWHFLCVARLDGVEKARKKLITIDRDQRVPMAQVFDLFAGKGTPNDVLKAAQNSAPEGSSGLKGQLFYAHLYLGLYFEAIGEAAKARDHIFKAAGEFSQPHYMGDVARLHAALFRQGKPQPAPARTAPK